MLSDMNTRIHYNIHGQPYRIKGKKPGPKNVVKKEVISLRLYPSTIARLRDTVRREGVTMSAFIEKARFHRESDIRRIA